MRILKWITVSLTALATPVMAANSPFTKPDGTWVSLSGTAVETGPSSFTLDYGKGSILVEMDDWAWYEQDGYGLLDGDKVRVYGEIDDDFAEITKLEADSVYVESLGSYFYANSADEEDYRVSVVTPIITGVTEVSGTVSSVDGREFTVDSGPREVTIDTSTMGYNPLDKEGFQKVEKGDRVSVTGNMENDFLETMELMADTVITLEEDNA